MTRDKSELLKSLTIDRSAATAERSGRRWLPIVATAVACVIASAAAFAVYEFRQQDSRNETAPQPAAQPQASQPPPPSPPPQAAANARPSGTLAASGYVVARRKATVAAEITGKVVEVFIDEGMTVTEGQVVARLDSVLAEKDYELARSRVETADAAIAAINADLQDATRIMSRLQTLSQKNFATEADLTRRRRGSACSARNCARCSRNSRPRRSTPGAAPRCSTSTRSAPPSPASSSTAARSPAR